MSNQNVLTRNFPSAICQHCGEVTNISFSHCYRQLVAKNKTLSELNSLYLKTLHKRLNVKNGQIQAMHKTVAQLINLLDENQEAQAKKICQEMRDLIKKANNEKTNK